jgi:hypothetical protein
MTHPRLLLRAKLPLSRGETESAAIPKGCVEPQIIEENDLVEIALSSMRFSIILFLLAFALPSRSQTATFNITYNGFTPEAQMAFQYAADQWSNIVVSNIPIKVNAYYTALLPGLLGITFPNGRKDFSGAPMQTTWYATSLANAIADTELNPGESDIDMYLNSSIDWYYDSTGTVPSTQYDLVSVVMHELCHGLGFASRFRESCKKRK